MLHIGNRYFEGHTYTHTHISLSLQGKKLVQWRKHFKINIWKCFHCFVIENDAHTSPITTPVYVNLKNMEIEFLTCLKKSFKQNVSEPIY